MVCTKETVQASPLGGKSQSWCPRSPVKWASGLACSGPSFPFQIIGSKNPLSRLREHCRISWWQKGNHPPAAPGFGDSDR